MYRKITPQRARGHRMLLRAGLDVPVGARGTVADAFRLERALPTLRLLQRAGARTILLGHRGEPHGHTRAALSLRPLVPWFQRALRARVRFASWPAANVRRVSERLRPGEIVLVENLRFCTGEETAKIAFARQLAALGDVFVNDDFATAHRAHASTTLLPRLLPSFAGLLLDEELRTLQKLRSRLAHPAVAVIGGSKVHDKLDVLRAFVRRYDHVLLGGAAANTVLAAQGRPTGASLVDKGSLRALRLMAHHPALVLPIDVVTAASPSARIRTAVAVADVRRTRAAYDLGPASIAHFGAYLRAAATVFWSGPLGYIEQPAYTHATRQLAGLLNPRTQFTVAGGGDTVAALRRLGLAKRFSYLSTGGSAMLALLAGHRLPAVTALMP